MIKRVLSDKSLLYIPEIIKTKIINRYYNNPLVGHFGIKKTQKLVVQKHHLKIFRANIKPHIKKSDVCLALKSVKHKLYSDLQSLQVLTHWWKDLFIYFIIRLPVSTNCKYEIYNWILVIVNRLIQMVHYKPVKVTMNVAG